MAAIDQTNTEQYSLINGDCEEVMREFPNKSGHLTLYSPPFAGLYQYSSDPQDMSNCIDKDEFFVHYGFCIDEVARLTQNAPAGSSQLNLNTSNVFNSGNKRYLCLLGQNNYLIQAVTGSTVTLATPLLEDHLINESVGLVKAITYRIDPDTTNLVRDENTGEGGQILAEDVENIQVRYTLASGGGVDSPANPEDIRMVSVTLTVRTKTPYTEYPGDGYLRRVMTTGIEVRNLAL